MTDFTSSQPGVRLATFSPRSACSSVRDFSGLYTVVAPDALCRKIRFIRRRDQRLDALAPDELHELRSSYFIELTHYIIQQKHRIFPRLRTQEFQLRKLQSQHSRTLLALRAKGAKMDAVDLEQDIVPVWSDSCLAAQNVQLCRLLQFLIIP